MTATEKIAISKIASLTDDQLFSTWESTEKHDRENYMAQVMLRGWCMDEIEKRYPKGFDAWLDQDAPEDKDLRRYCLTNPMCLTCAKFGKDCDGSTNQVWTGCIYKEAKQSAQE